MEWKTAARLFSCMCYTYTFFSGLAVFHSIENYVCHIIYG